MVSHDQRELVTMTNQEVAEAFARQKSGRSEHMRTDGISLWSYETEVARWLVNGEVVWATTLKYSVSTSTHINRALRALPFKDGVIRCESVRQADDQVAAAAEDRAYGHY